ncbi:MAG: F0F1 ATP synthase subunit B [Micrococcaceae bacterium]
MDSIYTTASSTFGATTSNPLIPDPWEILITTISFFLLLYIVVKKVSPSFEKTFQKRIDAIKGGLSRAERAQREADAAKRKYNQQLAGVREEANRIREQARADGVRIIEEMKTQAQAESDRIVALGHKQLESERNNAELSLQNDVGGLATSLAEKIVGESLEDDDRSNRVIERFLDNLEKPGQQDKVRVGD